MEHEVEEIRVRRPPKPKRSTEDDSMEPGMSLPSSVLDDCGDSFVAADEKREKASTQFFSDTGIMAFLCRHDRCLFAVNMTHKGERQHYALALVRKFFQHIPANATLGLLYDIACQLKRSMINFGFLSDCFPRMTFAVSIFHAYGHQWPCQVRYHPRKCQGFGLSDGEGCERFWSAIRKLIPCLRVSGVSTSKTIHTPALMNMFPRSIIKDYLFLIFTSNISTTHPVSTLDPGFVVGGTSASS